MATYYKLRCCVTGHEKDVRALTALAIPDDSFLSGSRDVTAKVWVPNEYVKRSKSSILSL